MPHPAYRRTPRVALGPTDAPILAALGRFFYLTAAQLTRLVYAPASHTYAQARLKRLSDAGYAQRLFLPRPTRTGSAPLVYTPSRAGLNALIRWGQSVERRYRPADARALSYLHLQHTLELNDVLIALELLCRRTPGLELVELRHERTLKLRPLRVALPDGRSVSVIPDGWVDLRVGGRYQECYLIEVDRGTTAQRAWRRKVAALLACMAGAYQAAFGTPSLTIVVVATPGVGRRDALLRWTEAELVAQGRLDAASSFRFTGVAIAQTRPEDVFRGAAWLTPFTPRLEPLLDLSDMGGARA